MSELTEAFPWLADVQRTVDERLASSGPGSDCAVHVCLGRHCQRRGGRQLVRAFESALAEHDVDDCPIVKVGCRDRCDDAPSVDVFPGPARYNRIGPHDANQIVARIAGHDVVEGSDPGQAAAPPWQRDRVLSRREQRHAERRRGTASE